MSEAPLFGEAGKRKEHVEWGVRWPSTTFLHRRGEVSPAVGPDHAQRMAEHTYWAAGTTYHGEAVSRTVVTYTTDWGQA